MSTLKSHLFNKVSTSSFSSFTYLLTMPLEISLTGFELFRLGILPTVTEVTTVPQPRSAPFSFEPFFFFLQLKVQCSKKSCFYT